MEDILAQSEPVSRQFRELYEQESQHCASPGQRADLEKELVVVAKQRHLEILNVISKLRTVVKKLETEKALFFLRSDPRRSAGMLKPDIRRSITHDCSLTDSVANSLHRLNLATFSGAGLRWHLPLINHPK